LQVGAHVFVKRKDTSDARGTIHASGDIQDSDGNRYSSPSAFAQAFGGLSHSKGWMQVWMSTDTGFGRNGRIRLATLKKRFQARERTAAARVTADADVDDNTDEWSAGGDRHTPSTRNRQRRRNAAAAATTVAVLPHSGNVEASAEPDTEREEETDESVTTDAGEI